MMSAHKAWMHKTEMTAMLKEQLAMAGALAALSIWSLSDNAVARSSTARAEEAPTKRTMAGTYLLVELGYVVLSTILKRGHFGR